MKSGIQIQTETVAEWQINLSVPFQPLPFQGKQLGKALWKAVLSELNLNEEEDYFGLKFKTTGLAYLCRYLFSIRLHAVCQVFYLLPPSESFWFRFVSHIDAYANDD